MARQLQVSSAHTSEAGKKSGNEDACGVRVPDDEGQLINKGIVAVIADGVSASDAGKEASNGCVQGFLTDYFSTPDSWTVKTSAHKVLTALNRWLHGQGHKLYGSERGMVTTLSVLILKSTTAHLFHVGDTRIYRLRNNDFECLTRDHKVKVGNDKEYLGRAMGIDINVDIDYRKVSAKENDLYLMTTDGVHDFVSNDFMIKTLKSTKDLAEICKTLVDTAASNKSHDNLTCQLMRIDSLPDQDQDAAYQELTKLPFPPALETGMILDGYKILREIHASKRTQLYLAVDQETGKQVALKTPSINYEDDPTYIDLFLHEEWVGKRLNNTHVLKICDHQRKRQFLYCVTEYVDGTTLRQWMRDHPTPTIVEVRHIIEQIARGLRAFHRLEMIHQDLKPENIMIDQYGVVKIIDFGSTKIAGIEEITSPVERISLLGTINYTAPEYVRNEMPTNRSDIFSVGVIAYEMLTGQLPYKERSFRKKITRLDYISATEHNPEVSDWIDGALKKAVDPDNHRRYDTLSEFIQDLTKPNMSLINTDTLPLMERNPVVFWRTVSLALFITNLVLAYYLLQ